MEINTSEVSTINISKFYGKKLNKNVLSEEPNINNKQNKDYLVPFELRRLLGPTSIWKVFKKQVDVLNFVKNKKCEIMSFVFQQSNGQRLFLAAHPRWLWHYDSKKDSDCRCSYEIISEYTVCKLYFDLEFEIVSNPNRNGAAMTDTFIEIVCFYINFFWNVIIDRSSVIDLESSTNLKFSRHLIFNSSKLVFRDNYNVGMFVKYMCREVKDCINKIENNCDDSHPLISKCKLGTSCIKMLKVINSKNNYSLFCDEGVYTKNRHFRLFKSTKPQKKSPLLLSKQNLYVPIKQLDNVEEQLFLDSLITYLPNVNDNQNVLHFNDNGSTASIGIRSYTSSTKENRQSPFPKIDGFIENVVHPGHVWRNNYFQTSNIIVYDVVGNRYCGNIGRYHRSNNIKIVVDIEKQCYYQKCYDPECFNYRSELCPLPPEIQFFLEDEFDKYISENDILFEVSDLDDSQLYEIANVVEQNIAYGNFSDANG